MIFSVYRSFLSVCRAHLNLYMCFWRAYTCAGGFPNIVFSVYRSFLSVHRALLNVYRCFWRVYTCAGGFPNIARSLLKRSPVLVGLF